MAEIKPGDKVRAEPEIEEHLAGLFTRVNSARALLDPGVDGPAEGSVKTEKAKDELMKAVNMIPDLQQFNHPILDTYEEPETDDDQEELSDV